MPPARGSAAALARCDEALDAVVVEAHAVDQALRRHEAEQARLRVAGLRARRDGAGLDVAEAEGPERVDVRGVLVHAGGEPHRVAEGEAHGLHRQVGDAAGATSRVSPNAAA